MVFLFNLLFRFQFSSVAQSCPTLCDPMDYSMPGFPVHHQLLEFTQTHVYQVCDAIQPSHPLSSPSPPALNLSQRQGLFQWVSSWLWPTLGGQSIAVSASVLSTNIPGWVPLGLTGWSPCCPGDSQKSSPASQSESISSSALSFLYGPTLKSVNDYWKNQSFDYLDLFWQSDTLSRFVIAFLPKSKCLLISWLQSPSTVIPEPKKIKSVTVCIFSPSICHEVMGPDAMILVFLMFSFNLLNLRIICYKTLDT